MSDTKVKVAVRVRPMNRRELELNTKCVVEMEGNQTVLHPPPSNTKQGERKPPKVSTEMEFDTHIKCARIQDFIHHSNPCGIPLPLRRKIGVLIKT
ncbi:ki13a_mouse ame: full=kinesin-like protein kif13a [Lynx pardinus]|uniref:Kinesin-like protein kif13a n=1 Tax=Lynx pardinus TaxID=191816 RepID=A0A485PFT5_LYNPA|nr:ki13a_mouse ame: full=kinesin-like protein kif13a [Lynx pardinus]